MALYPNAATPLYIQIKDTLQAQIESGALAVGDRLPSERELADAFGVSRMTARQALQLLQQNGLSRRQVGKGSYVSRPQIDQELRELTSFSQDMSGRGLHPASRVLRAELLAADIETASQLRAAPGEEIVVLQRVRLADGKAIALETAHLLHRLCPGILDHYDFAVESLYRVLQADYGLHQVWANQVIGARMPSRAERMALGLSPRTPVLSLQRVTYDQEDRPIEFVRSCYHSERFQLHTVLRELTANEAGTQGRNP
jgi:GntR family transcriptional regulator